MNIVVNTIQILPTNQINVVQPDYTIYNVVSFIIVLMVPFCIILVT